ncbi:glycoside hydrolase family 16 protein [Phlebopus sp. FC_14]|nr:glycoside hydrolase family 16 protein [Phlebopus sp. FC_14]
MRPEHALTSCVSFAAVTFAQLLPVWPEYKLTDSYVGFDFYKRFTWQVIDDPTNGRVNYVNKTTAQTGNLTFASEDYFVMRADHSTVVAPGARGRDSVRIQSQDVYKDVMLILDLSHMPEGCSTWPAWWTLSKEGPWPHGGEIDIIEGVNLASTNLASLHTTPDCNMTQYRSQKGTTTSTVCDTSYNGNQGCGTSFNTSTSYGTAFNQAGGGYYVMERDGKKGISMWFMQRSTDSLLRDVIDPNVISRSTPDAFFPTQENCNYQEHFDDHQIVFDLTFCGDWAGASWGGECAEKAPSCKDFVNDHPDEFSEAYWEIKSLQIYTRESDSLLEW